MDELIMLREQIRDKELQAQENQASSQVIKHMLQTGAAKYGKEGGITVMPAQSAFEYGVVTPNKMEDEQQPEKDEQQQPSSLQIVNTSGGMIDTNH